MCSADLLFLCILKSLYQTSLYHWNSLYWKWVTFDMLQGLYIVLSIPLHLLVDIELGYSALSIRISMLYFLSFCSSKCKTKYRMNKQRVLHVYKGTLLARASFIIHTYPSTFVQPLKFMLEFTNPIHYIVQFILVLLSAIRHTLLYFSSEWTLGCNATAWVYLYTLTKIYSNTHIQARHTCIYNTALLQTSNIFKILEYLDTSKELRSIQIPV